MIDLLSINIAYMLFLEKIKSESVSASAGHCEIGNTEIQYVVSLKKSVIGAV